ncbi:MAG: hypothetical protein ACK4NF_00015 [Planctomycetota bacterium]
MIYAAISLLVIGILLGRGCGSGLEQTTNEELEQSQTMVASKNGNKEIEKEICVYFLRVDIL